MAEVESEEAFVDDPAEVTWLAEFLYGASVDGPLQLPSSTWAGVCYNQHQRNYLHRVCVSCYFVHHVTGNCLCSLAVTMEMKQVSKTQLFV